MVLELDARFAQIATEESVNRMISNRETVEDGIIGNISRDVVERGGYRR